MYYFIITASATFRYDNIEQLTGNNFPKWKDQVLVSLGCNDLDLALREPRPEAPPVDAAGYDELKKVYDIKA